MGVNACFYHAGDIVGDIDPSKGRTGLDFNPANKGGFNVTTYLDQATDWATKRDLPTITKFDVPDSELAKLNIKNFNGATDEWADSVTKGRQGKLAHDFDMVSGPMVNNPPQIRKGKAPVSTGHQYAIFRDEAADVFNKNKVGKIECH